MCSWDLDLLLRFEGLVLPFAKTAYHRYSGSFFASACSFLAFIRFFYMDHLIFLPGLLFNGSFLRRRLADSFA